MFAGIRGLPVLRSRSSVEFGVYFSIVGVLVFAAAFAVVSPRVLRDPPNELLAAMAGVGSAVFISYTVGVSGLVRQVRRGSDTEILLGFLTGLSICGIFGVGMAVILIAVSKPFGWLAELALAWAAISVMLLAGIVAALPLFAYDDSRIKHRNPDE